MYSYTYPRVRAARGGRSWLGLLPLLALVLFASPARSQQTGALEGRVLDAATSTPLAGVSVMASGTSLGTLSGSDGRFRITGIEPGTHQVTAKRVGLAPQTQSVRIAAGETATVEFYLTEAAVLLPEVVVSATREAQRLSETAATVGVISSQELRDAKPTHPSDIMQRIPGVWVNKTSGEGHMMAIRLPMSTKPMYLYLEDGVPTRSTGFFNHNALYEVNLPQAGRIEVLKGPSSTALYGSDAIGGVVNVETRDPSLLPSANAYAEAGAYGWGRVLLSASDTWGDNGVRADLNLTRTDGWREGTNYNRQSATVRWDRDLGDAALKTVLTASRVEQQTAGSSQLLRDDYLTAPTENYTPISYRSVKAVRFSTAYEREMGATLLSVTPYLRYNDMELLPNWSLTYDPTVYSTGHSSVGMLAKVRQDLPAIATRIIAGVDVDYSPGGRLEHSIDPVREANIFTDYSLGEVLYDYDVTYHAVSPYIQAEANPTDRLYLSAGVRYDRMGYDYDSHLQPLQEGSHRRPADTEISYDHLSPKVGATLDLGRGLNFYGNYSHGFRVPSEGQIFQQGSAENTVGLEPVLANSVELGMRGELGGRFGYSLALYRMVVENDILTYIRPDGLRENQNAGETLHQGFEMGLGAVLTESLRADLSYSYAQHTYEEWTPRPEVDYGGNEQEGAPNILASTRLTYTPSFVPDGEISIAWRHLGGYWMDPTNLHEYPGHDIVDLSLEMPVTPEVELIGRAMNLTNEHYAETASFNEFRGEEFAPGMPRTLYLGVQYRWLGDKQ